MFLSQGHRRRQTGPWLMVSLLLASLWSLAACEVKPPAVEETAPEAKDEHRDVGAVEEGAVDLLKDASVPDLEYLEFVTGAVESDDKLPMIVMMHGLGDRPSSYRSLFLPHFSQPARIILPQAPDSYSGGYSWFPTPKQLESGDPAMLKGMERSAKAVVKLIRKLRLKRSTQGKAIVSGFSQGGMLSFVIAARHPESVQLAVPIAGWLPPQLMPEGEGPIEGAPRIIALHGDADERVKLGPTREAVEALKARGVDSSLEVFERAAHSFPPRMRVRFYNILREVIEP